MDEVNTSDLAGMRIAIAVTAPRSAAFYEGQLAALVRAGAEVFFVSSPSEEVARHCAAEGATHVPIAMERAPAPWRDVRALAEATRALARIRPDVVNAGTPKAGLVVTLAARAVGVPVRVHTLHGLRYEAAHGAARRILWLAQRASCAAATHVVCVSPSLRDRAIATGLIRDGIVIGDGSVNGVDVARFRPGRRDGSPVVVGYLGRLAADKGLAALAAAWRRIGSGAHLVVAGDVDRTDPPPAAVLAELDSAMVGPVDDPAAFLAGIDVLVLPSRREGFPSAPLEAAAAGLPVVATRATGCVDAVVDGVTGTLVPVDDPAALADAIAAYVREPDLRRRHGAAGRERAVAQFSRDHVHRLTIDFYRSIYPGRSGRASSGP